MYFQLNYLDLGTYGITTNSITLPGATSQYVRGDGTLSNFPSSSGGGASVSYYLNGSVNQGTIGGAVYEQINKVPVVGTGTDFTINADGYIAQFITDSGDPNKLVIPAGNWNFETYFSATSGGGSPRFYIELSKYDGTLFTPIASNSATPEYITGGANIDLYFTALAVPQTTLALTDRLAVRFYVIHSSKTITMHTENSHLSQIITTFSTGLTALNGLTAQVQTFATPGTTGTAPAWSSSTSIHTLNIPLASASSVTAGLISKTDYDNFAGKQAALVSGTNIKTINGTTLLGSGDLTVSGLPSGVQGNILYHNGTNWVVLSPGTSGYVLTTNGAAANPSWNLSSGGMTNPMTTLGDVISGGASGTPTRVVGNTASTRQFLMSQGVGGSATAPSFQTILLSDVAGALSYQNLYSTNPSSYTPLINGNRETIVNITGLAQTVVIVAPSSSTTPIVDGDKLIFRITSDSTTRTLSWSTASGGYIQRGASLPGSTVPLKMHIVTFLYNSVATKWDCVGAVIEF